MPFGSGHCPTTRLARLGLQQVDLRERDVLGLDTGSGVLAIAAVKLGARRATGIDRDPDAPASARNSVAANQLASRVEPREGDVPRMAANAVPAGGASGSVSDELSEIRGAHSVRCCGD